MVKKSNFFILMGILLLYLNSVHAAPFEVKVISIKDKIVVDEVAEFDIVIQNNLETDEEFIVKKAGYPFWDMYTKPLQNPITFKVPALSTSSIRLYVDPLYITSVDTYTLETGVVLERTGDEFKVPITVGIKSTEPLISGYIPTVITTTSIIPEKIDPREGFTIRLIMKNQNVIDYPNLTVKIESNLFRDELYYPLAPNEEKSIEIPQKIDDMTIPQQDRMVVSVFRDKRMIVSPIIKEFEIKEYSTQEEIPREESFLKIKSGYKVSSNNPYYKGSIKIETTPLRNLFLTTYPVAQTIKEIGKTFLVWPVELGPDRTMTVLVTENFRPIVVILALAIIAVALYFVFRSPIIVKKGIATVGMSEGGVSEAKIVIRVKNRSSNKILNIEVLDTVSHIVHVEQDISIGSMHPHAVLKHPKKGILIKWTIESLEPGDERVLSYRMKSMLSILGEFSLPAATARCKVGNKVIISNSNRLSIGG